MVGILEKNESALLVGIANNATRRAVIGFSQGSTGTHLLFEVSTSLGLPTVHWDSQALLGSFHSTINANHITEWQRQHESPALHAPSYYSAHDNAMAIYGRLAKCSVQRRPREVCPWPGWIQQMYHAITAVGKAGLSVSDVPYASFPQQLFGTAAFRGSLFVRTLRNDAQRWARSRTRNTHGDGARHPICHESLWALSEASPLDLYDCAVRCEARGAWVENITCFVPISTVGLAPLAKAYQAHERLLDRLLMTAPAEAKLAVLNLDLFAMRSKQRGGVQVGAVAPSFAARLPPRIPLPSKEKLQMVSIDGLGHAWQSGDRKNLSASSSNGDTSLMNVVVIDAPLTTLFGHEVAKTYGRICRNPRAAFLRLRCKMGGAQHPCPPKTAAADLDTEFPDFSIYTKLLPALRALQHEGPPVDVRAPSSARPIYMLNTWEYALCIATGSVGIHGSEPMALWEYHKLLNDDSCTAASIVRQWYHEAKRDARVPIRQSVLLIGPGPMEAIAATSKEFQAGGTPLSGRILRWYEREYLWSSIWWSTAPLVNWERDAVAGWRPRRSDSGTMELMFNSVSVPYFVDPSRWRVPSGTTISEMIQEHTRRPLLAIFFGSIDVRSPAVREIRQHISDALLRCGRECMMVNIQTAAKSSRNTLSLGRETLRNAAAMNLGGRYNASKLYRRSRYCVIPAGDTVDSKRLYSAILSLCIPVKIWAYAGKDAWSLPFPHTIDWDRVGPMLDGSQAQSLVATLRRISKEQEEAYVRYLIQIRDELLWHTPATASQGHWQSSSEGRISNGHLTVPPAFRHALEETLALRPRMIDLSVLRKLTLRSVNQSHQSPVPKIAARQIFPPMLPQKSRTQSPRGFWPLGPPSKGPFQRQRWAFTSASKLTNEEKLSIRQSLMKSMRKVPNVATLPQPQ